MCCDWVIECITFGVQVIMQCLYAEKKYSVRVAENNINSREKVMCRLNFSKIRNISRYRLGSHMFIVIQLWTVERVIE